MPDINGIPYVESTDLVSGWPTVSQSVAQEVSDQLAQKLPYSYGTATPSTTDSGFLWYDSNSTPAAPKFWDGAAFQTLGGAGGGKILQIVRATDGTSRTTTSTSFVDANISVTITPTASDSAILLIWAANAIHGGTSDFIWMQITDSSNNPVSGANGAYIGSNTTVAISTFATIIGYATPATTSAVTYKGRFRVNANGTAELYNAGNLAQLYAIEVAA